MARVTRRAFVTGAGLAGVGAALGLAAVACGGSPAGPGTGNQGAWQTLAPMPAPRQELATAVLNGLIYVIGCAGAWVYWKRRRDLVPILLAVIPMGMAAVQSYGGACEAFLPM